MQRDSGGRAGGQGVALAPWLFVALLAVLWSATALAGGSLVRVAAVIDGDTCQLTDGRRLRLAGIDAPEVAHDGRPAQYYAAESAARLDRLTRDVPLRFVGVGPKQDRFGRLLGDLILPDGASVAKRQVAEGAAFCFWFADVPGELADRLLAAQQQAMAGGKGLWPRLLALPAPARPYVGNASSRRFHGPDCPDAARVSRRNRVPLATLAEAFSRGFAPARDCTPWPEARQTGHPDRSRHN
ncbi:thermonuclease family protein [Solidesulfovibrio sp.]